MSDSRVLIELGLMSCSVTHCLYVGRTYSLEFAGGRSRLPAWNLEGMLECAVERRHRKPGEYARATTQEGVELGGAETPQLFRHVNARQLCEDTAVEVGNALQSALM